jgi:exodeoxyribonuclease VII small subunit
MTQKKPSYREAIAEIEEILSSIENNEPDIDELANKVKRVSTLLKLCKDKLHKTQNEVEKVLNDMDQTESDT